jgi:hypothetical protein
MWLYMFRLSINLHKKLEIVLSLVGRTIELGIWGQSCILVHIFIV